MGQNHLEFEMRLRRLMRKHRAMANGYTTRMRPDGLIVARPRRTQPPISGRSVLIFLGAFFVFKGFLLASLGPATYEDRLNRLEAGTVLEQAGGWVMTVDPVSQFIAQKMGPLLR